MNRNLSNISSIILRGKIKALLSLFILMLNGLGLYLYYDTIPPLIASHYNIKGIADSTSDKFFLVELFLLSAFITIILFVLAKYPQIHNHPFKIKKEYQPLVYAKSADLLYTLALLINLYFIMIAINAVFDVNIINTYTIIMMILLPMIIMFKHLKYIYRFKD